MRILVLPTVVFLALGAGAAGVVRADEVSDALDEAADLAGSCDFTAAARRLDAARAAGARDGELERRLEDFRLAARGLESFAALVREHGDRFRSVTLKPGFTVSLKGADAEGMDASLRGGETRVPWSTLHRKAWSALWERAKAPTDSLLPLSGLLHEVQCEDEAEEALVAALGAGASSDEVSRIYARWMEEPVPPGGYVVFDERLMSPQDRDAEILEGRKAEAYARLVSGDAAAESAAVQELQAMGPPARFTLYKGLNTLRRRRIDDLVAHKAFTAPSTRLKLKTLLEERRATALALIEDPVKYPYDRAHPTKKGQEEVDRLVDLVREVWDSPLVLVRQWDPSVEPLLARIAEVDRWLAAVDEDSPQEPDMEAVHAAVRDAIGVREFFPDPYSRDVLAYNLEVDTTADPEERDNVLAVNEYRMMMGRQAVKIHERLLRAARGHSRHMRLNNYFDHNSKFKGLENPGVRAKRQGYSGGVSENIAYGRPTGRGAFWGWFHSSGHHRNMLGKGHTEMGAGRSHSHFTQVFGRLTGKSLKQPDPLPPPPEDVAPDPPPDEEGG